jgi:hypothetical protein
MSFPSLTFTIGGKPFLIPAHVLNKGWVAPTSQACFSGIRTLDEDFGEILPFKKFTIPMLIGGPN